MKRMKSATMNKAKVILTSAVISTLMAASAFAGTWTRTYTSPDGESETYSTLWCYIKDDGTYAQNEWVQDADGTWYWVEYDCTLPITSGISADGFLYDSDGRYIPMEGRFFPTVIRFLPSSDRNMSVQTTISYLPMKGLPAMPSAPGSSALTASTAWNLSMVL